MLCGLLRLCVDLGLDLVQRTFSSSCGEGRRKYNTLCFKHKWILISSENEIYRVEHDFAHKKGFIRFWITYKSARGEAPIFSEMMVARGRGEKALCVSSTNPQVGTSNTEVGQVGTKKHKLHKLAQRKFKLYKLATKNFKLLNTVKTCKTQVHLPHALRTEWLSRW